MSFGVGCWQMGIYTERAIRQTRAPKTIHTLDMLWFCSKLQFRILIRVFRHISCISVESARKKLYRFSFAHA